VSAPNSSRGQLDYLDQAGLELLRATKRGQLVQGVWVYEHPLNAQGLAEFHQRLGTGLFGRLIERSPLPFARPHWVSCDGPPMEIITSSVPRPRAELMDWADELATRPIDPEYGPGWMLAVQPLTDGATAVSAVVSHCLVDGGGALVAVWDAVLGNRRDFGYLPPRSRSRIAAAASDLRETVREVPHLVKGLSAVARIALKEKAGTGGAAAAASSAGDDATVVTIPAAVAIIDTQIWDARAAALGGHGFSLAVGYAARVARHLGRTRASDGAVSLILAGSGRTGLDDDRALAMTFATAVVDPVGVTADLTETRNAARAARDKVKTDPDASLGLLPLVPWFPQPIAKAFASEMFAYDDAPPVSCSNMGELPADIARLDGTAAEVFFARSVDQNVTLRDLRRSRGTLVVVTGRINGKVWIAVEAYQLDADNSREHLRSVLEQTLAEFGLTGEVD
jgi:hypothetical protein